MELPHTWLPQRNQIKMKPLGHLQRKLEVPKQGHFCGPMQPAGQLKINRAVCPLLGGHCGGLGGRWHVCKIHQSNLVFPAPAGTDGLRSNFLRLPESLPSPRTDNTLALLPHPPLARREEKNPEEI